MTIEAVFFDLGGVILRTEHQAPREHLAERLGVSYGELVRLVFESESARRASLGEISAQEHWDALAKRLGRGSSEAQQLRDEFFGGDVLDRELIGFIRGLRPRIKTGLISNAWLDMREFIRQNRFEDAFEEIVISAEVGTLKPGRAIYELALTRLGVAAEASAMVDDFPENVRGANDVGMVGIQFRDTLQVQRELLQLIG